MPAGRFFQRHQVAVLLVSFLAPLVACALLALVRDAIDNTNAALILVLLVVAAASTGLRLAGLLAAASSAASFDFFSPLRTAGSPSTTVPTSRPQSC